MTAVPVSGTIPIMKARKSMIQVGFPLSFCRNGAVLTAQATTMAVTVRTQMWVYAFGLRSERVYRRNSMLSAKKYEPRKA